MTFIRENVGRYYEHEGRYLPSVTTILGYDADMSWLDAWRDRIGHEEADRISKSSAERGNFMHKIIENYLTFKRGSIFSDDLFHAVTKTHIEFPDYHSTVIKSAVEMVKGMHEFGLFKNIKSIVGLEVKLVNLGYFCGYAGRTDDMHIDLKDRLIVVDFKNSIREKKVEYIEGYKEQGAAYSHAYYDMTGKFPHSTEIWIMNAANYIPQIFTLSSKEVDYYFDKFLVKLKNFSENVTEPTQEELVLEES